MRKATRSAFPIVQLLLGARRFETGRSHIGRGCALPGRDDIGQGSGGGFRSLYGSFGGSFCRSFGSVFRCLGGLLGGLGGALGLQLLGAQTRFLLPLLGARL